MSYKYRVIDVPISDGVSIADMRSHLAHIAYDMRTLFTTRVSNWHGRTLHIFSDDREDAAVLASIAAYTVVPLSAVRSNPDGVVPA